MSSRRRMFKIGLYAVGLAMLLVGVACSSAPTPTRSPTATPVPPTATPVPPPPTATPLPGVTPKPVVAAPTPTAVPAPAVALPGEQPQYGGVLKMVNAGDPRSIDPLNVNVTQYYDYWGNVYNRLVKYTPFPAPGQDYSNGEVIPDLAESWTVADDLKSYTFHLRPAVKFHDGSAFTVEDAKWSVEQIKARQAHSGPFLSEVSTVEAVNASTLKINLSVPRASLLQRLAIWTMPMLSKAHYAKHGPDIDTGPNVGTGPFMEGKYVTSVSATFNRNPKYWDVGLPYLDGFKMIIIDNPATRFAAFRSHKIDVLGPGVTGVNRVQMEDLQRSVPHLTPNEQNKMSYYILQFQTRLEPWNDVRVRKAAHLAIDRWEALKVLEDGLKPAGTLIPGWGLTDEELYKLPGYAKTGPAKDAERAEARKLLADAGYPNGIDTEMNTVMEVGRLVKAQVFHIDQLSKIGIRAKSKPIPLADFLVRWRAKDPQWKTITVQAGGPFPDPDSMTQVLVVPGPHTTLDDAKLAELFEKQAEAKTEARNEMIKEIQLRMLDILPHTGSVWVGAYWPSHPAVKGFMAKLAAWSGHHVDHVWIKQN